MLNIKSVFLYLAPAFYVGFISIAIFLSFTPSVGAAGVNIFGASPFATPAPSTGVVNCVADDSDPNSCLKQNPVYLWLAYFINLFVIISVVGSAVMIAYAGVEYISAGGNAEKTKSARDKIRNVVIGLLALVFMSAFLQWLIPGGVF